MSSAAPHRAVLTVRGDVRRERRDRLAGEEPMEIRVAPVSGEPRPVAVTMRTPGHDFELAVGFLVTEGVIEPGRVRRVAYCDDVEGDQLYNVVTVRTDGAIALGESRRVASTSACGICGKSSLDEVEVRCAPLGAGPRIARETVLALPERLRAAQRVFDATGGLHAAGLFDAEGLLITVREDVGPPQRAWTRWSGAPALAGELPLADRALMVSRPGRLRDRPEGGRRRESPSWRRSSAPSSLAVEAAERFGMTLVGFLRGDGFNVYARPDRILGLMACRDPHARRRRGPLGRPPPNGIGLTKPNHYRDMLRWSWENRRALPYACADPAQGRLRRLRARASPGSTTGPSTACTSARPG